MDDEKAVGPSSSHRFRVSTDDVIKVGHATVYPGVDADNWQIERTSAWISHNNPVNEFVELKILMPFLVYGVVLKGRTDYDQWLTHLEIFTSLNGIHWKSEGEFVGSTDRNTPTMMIFKKPVLVSRLKFTNFKFHDNMSARFGLIRD